MGEVYRARDTRLDRTVALKVLNSHLAPSPEWRQRFEREARSIAALSHPHICILHDVGRQDGIDFLVMEYLEGQTLADRLKKGLLPPDQVLRYGVEIASALDQAHSQGIVHRDLKPANVMITKTGTKLLDFGLAKLLPEGAPSTAVSDPTALPTPEIPLTAKGTIVGTVQYMAPEQLEGREPDARTDIFALGAVLYEMATGQRAFTGKSQASLVAAILSSHPVPLSKLDPQLPPALDHAVANCLAKDPEERWQSAHDVAAELRWIAEGGSGQGGRTGRATGRRDVERLAWASGALVALLVFTLVWMTMLRAPVRSEKPLQVRFEVAAPEKEKFSDWTMAFSPAGDRIAFAASAGGRARLWVRALDSPVATPISGTENGQVPVWSPDGREIVFGADGKVKKVELSSGPAQILCDDEERSFFGGSWSRDGTLILALRNELFRLPAAGGEPKQLGKRAEGEIRRYWPQFLPDGRHYLYVSLDKQPDKQGIYVGSLDSDDRRLILRTEYNAAYMYGHLLFVRGGALVAQPFDVKTLTLSGVEIILAGQLALYNSQVLGAAASEAVFSVSGNGALAWRPASPPASTSLTWFDRAGRNLGTLGEPAVYSNPALSPDDGRLAVDRRDPQTGQRDIWIFDLVRGGRTRLTFDRADDFGATWSPDGKRVAFTSDRRGEREIYQKLANGSGSEELLVESKGRRVHAEDWALDGSLLLFNSVHGADVDLFVLPLSSSRDSKPVPFLATEFWEEMGQFSPDRRFLGYRSIESGRSEVYVRDISPDGTAGRGKWQVSTDGGIEPRWRRDGKELFYVSGPAVESAAVGASAPGRFMAVGVKTDHGSFELGVPQSLFDARLPEWRRNRYVVTRDGQRFLVNTVNTALTEAIQPIQVLVNALP